MINTRNILSIVQHITRRQRGIADKRIMHPQREWLIGIIIALVAGGVGVSYATYIFLTYQSEVTTAPSVDIRPIRYDEAGVAQVLEVYAARENDFETLRNERGVIPLRATTTPAEEENSPPGEASPQF